MPFYKEISDILEEDVNESTVLKNCENWDSLSAISVVSLASSQYGVVLTTAELKAVSTVKDLLDLIQSKSK